MRVEVDAVGEKKVELGAHVTLAKVNDAFPRSAPRAIKVHLWISMIWFWV